MATVGFADFETGDLTQFDAVVNPDSDLSAAGAAAIHGSYGMQAVIDDTTAIYGQISIGNNVEYIFARWYFDPNSITMGDGERFAIAYFFGSGTPSPISEIDLYRTGGAYYIRCYACEEDGGTDYVGQYAISDAVHSIEVQLTRATDSATADGEIHVLIDNVDRVSRTDLDNYSNMQHNNLRMYLGAVNGIDAGTAGTIYFDDLEVNDDGTPIGPYAYTLTCANGSYVLTGQATGIFVGREVAAAHGTFTLSGQSAGLIADRTLPAAYGNFALTGQNVGLLADRKIDIAQGGYVLSGQAAGLRFGYSLAAASGSFALAGQNISLRAGRELAASHGTFTLGGQNVGLFADRTLDIDHGTLALSGQDVDLLYAAALTLYAETGTLALVGQSSGLLLTRLLQLANGAYTMTGHDVTLTYGTATTPPASRTAVVIEQNRISVLPARTDASAVIDERGATVADNNRTAIA